MNWTGRELEGTLAHRGPGPRCGPADRTGYTARVFRLRDVTQQYPGDGRPAVDAVSLDVAEGKTLALIGPSGCGKSTLLRLMLGLIEPTGGSVAFDGADVTADALKIRRRCGYVIQDGGLFPT